MEAKELRIGNYIYVEPFLIEQQVIEVMADCVNTNLARCPHFGMIDPILLDEKWLSKLGFQKIDTTMSGCHVYQKGIYRILKSFYDKERKYFSLCIDGIYPSTWAIARFLFVHQLQNVYFALSGEELTINQ